MTIAASTNGNADAPAETTSDVASEKPKFSWLLPHPVFVIILVGPDEHPFGIQKDFLCHRSAFYREHFAAKTAVSTAAATDTAITDKDNDKDNDKDGDKNGDNDKDSDKAKDSKNEDEAMEHIVKLPEFTSEVFGLAQNYLYTGSLFAVDDKAAANDKAGTGSRMPPSYESLVALWNLGHKLGIEGLCEKTLDAMAECRRLTDRIPATPLLIKVWRDTPEGSSIRMLLLSWAAEYMRSSEARAEFAKSLPQEVLSELVVAMSSFDVFPAAGGNPPAEDSPSTAATATAAPASAALPLRKNVHYLDEVSDEEALNSIKKSRRVSSTASAPAAPQDASVGRKPNRTPLPKPPKRRSSAAYLEGRNFTTSQKMEFCADLLNRMLSGPGFWTRLVGPFKDPVEPVDDGVPDYLDKVKRPMDLNSIKAKMDRREYANEEEFLADVRQIFDNCFTYWKKGDPMWAAGEKLQRTFEDKYSHMHRWIAKMGGDEGE